MSWQFPDVHPCRFVLSPFWSQHNAANAEKKCWLMFFRFNLKYLNRFKPLLSFEVPACLCVCVRVCITHVKSVQAVTCYGSRTSPPPRHHISASVLLHQGRGAGATCPKLWKKAENGNRSIHLSKSRSVTQSVSEAGSGEWALSLWARLGKSKDQLHRWCLLLRGEGWRGMVGWKLLLSAWVWADCMFALQPTQTK